MTTFSHSSYNAVKMEAIIVFKFCLTSLHWDGCFVMCLGYSKYILFDHETELNVKSKIVQLHDWCYFFLKDPHQIENNISHSVLKGKMHHKQ